MSGLTVRPATEDDRDDVTDVLAAAFADYVWTNWAVPDDGHQRRLRIMYDAFTVFTVRIGACWVTQLDGRIVSAALWNPPKPPQLPELAARLEEVERQAFADRRERNAAAENACRALHPAEEHWFLACVGTVPGARGLGAATAVLRPVLDRCDSDRLLAALDTSTAGNVRLYRQLGFEVIGETDPPGGAPHVWTMHRRPA
jgi:ribosomal protein S18 acetylase RimI-like enzyme